jgi:hypothetical protein
MKIILLDLVVRTRRTTEKICFSNTVTFLYGPVGTGKSTVARLIDYCFGGDLERTPAIQSEFISVVLRTKLGKYDCSIERSAEDTQSVRVTWNYGEEDYESANVPLKAGDHPIIEDIEAEVYNLSDLIFYLCNVRPIKVLKRSGDPESQMIRLSFRDIWRYCYLDQTHLDSSFYQLEDPFKGRKSQDAMRFFTGLHSEELSQLQVELYRAVEEQQGARQAVIQIRQFMARFDFGSEIELSGKIEKVKHELEVVESQKRELGAERLSDIHPTDDLRGRLRALSRIIADLHEAIDATQNALAEQSSLRAELITTKVKADRISRASSLFINIATFVALHLQKKLVLALMKKLFVENSMIESINLQIQLIEENKHCKDPCEN